jgi:hypothetical protein
MAMDLAMAVAGHGWAKNAFSARCHTRSKRWRNATMGVSCNGLQALDMGGRQKMPLARGGKGARKVGQNRLFRPSKTKNRPELLDFILYFIIKGQRVGSYGATQPLRPGNHPILSLAATPLFEVCGTTRVEIGRQLRSNEQRSNNAETEAHT